MPWLDYTLLSVIQNFFDDVCARIGDAKVATAYDLVSGADRPSFDARPLYFTRRIAFPLSESDGVLE